MKLSDIIPDNRNANKGNAAGRQLLQQSLERYGAGRSILIDKAGRIIAGNKTAEQFAELGDEVLVVQTDGSKLVAVQRTDLDLDSPEARALAIADNRVAEINLEWDIETLQELNQEGVVDLDDWFTPDEIAEWDDVEISDIDTNPKSNTQEIDVETFEFDCKCPKCGFEFIQQK